MALQLVKNINVFGESLSFDGAYVQIVNVSGNKEALTIEVAIYKDATKSIILEYKSYSFVPDFEENSLRWDKQGYIYLKTRPEYFGAINC